MFTFLKLKVLSNNSHYAIGTTNLHTSFILYQYSGTAQSLCSWSAITSIMLMLKYQAFTLRTLPVVGPPLVPDPGQVSKHASLVPRLESDKRGLGPH